MGKARNKKTKKNVVRTSRSMHVSRSKAKKSHLALSKEFSRKSYAAARKVVLAIIVIAMMSVILALITTFFNKPEDIVKSKIDYAARDYYENYFYEKILNNVSSSKSMSEIMQRYVGRGFTSVPLRQLMLFDSRRHAEAEEVLYKYCDPDETEVHFYPEEPFGAKDYRVEYKYACIF